MKGSDFIFDCVHLLYYKYHEINFKRRESYIDSLNWIQKYNWCCQYATTVALDHEEIEKHPEKITKTKIFIYK